MVWIGVPAGHHFEYFSGIGLKNPFPYFDNVISALLYGAGVRISFIVYPLYLLVRFITWVVRYFLLNANRYTLFAIQNKGDISEIGFRTVPEN